MAVIIFFASLLVSLFVTRSNADCQSTSPCVATCGGKAIDLSSLFDFPISFNDTKDGDVGANPKYMFTLNLCNGVDCNAQDNKLSPVCQIENAGGKQFACGSFDGVQWTNDSSGISVTYPDGKTNNDGATRQTTITLQEDSSVSAATIEYTGEKTDNKINIYSFTITYNPAAAASANNDIAGPIGWALIAVSIFGLLTYFIAGSIVMYFYKGARGMEIIPNLGFWKSFPFLIIDGCFFVISPCYKRKGSDYEKI